MEIENMNQKQLNNVKKILELTNKNVFDLNKPNVRQYVLEFISNCESEVVDTIFKWINNKKINNIDEVMKCVPLLNMAWANRIYKYDDFNERYSTTESTYEFAVKTLEEYKNYPNIELVMKIIANFGWIKDYDKCKKLYYNLIANKCFWLGSFDADMPTLINLIDANYACGKIISTIEPSFKQKSPFKKISAKKAYDKFYESENVLNNYIDQLILKCSKINEEDQRKNSIDEIKKKLKYQ